MSQAQKVRVRGLGPIIRDMLAGVDPTTAMRRAEGEREPSHAAARRDASKGRPTR